MLQMYEVNSLKGAKEKRCLKAKSKNNYVNTVVNKIFSHGVCIKNYDTAIHVYLS